ncbi:hypothetical protein VNI00_011885 [Paramarasmius palmivorus]|uniref:PIPK domain-containing protein n=1 Tax=Paramarasmius palmivorus TaxID=297713 RepID=A0AAW0C8W8_9AGAR
MADKPLPAVPQSSQFISSAAGPSAVSGSNSGTTSDDITKPRKKNAGRKASNHQNMTTLCVQAREHRARFVRFVLDEVIQEQDASDAAWLDRNKDELTWAIEDGLDELGRRMGQGGWLVGVKRARDMLESQSDLNLDFEDLDKASAIAQLREIAARPLPPTPIPTSKHLLLCLADVGSRIALPDEDGGFDIIPSQIRCIFKPDVFIFPEGTSPPEETLLYGYNEWNSTLSLISTTLRLVGGTFQFTSVPGSSSFHGCLAKIMKLAIYQHISLLLEQHLLADARVPLIFPSPSYIASYGRRNRVTSHGAVGNKGRPKLAEHHSSDYTGHKKGHGSKPSLIPSSIFSFFSKRSLGRANSLSSSSPTAETESELPIAIRGGSLDLRDSSVAGSGNEDNTPSRSSTDATIISPTPEGIGGRIRRFSFTPSPFSSKIVSPTSTTPTQSTINAEATHKPFTTLLQRLRESRDMLSTSPGVGDNIELPALIVQLANRENQSGIVKLRGDERVALKELLGWGEDGNNGVFAEQKKPGDDNSISTLGGGMLGTRGFLRHQALSALVSVYIPTKPSGADTVEESENSGDESEAGESLGHDNSSQTENSVAHAIQEQQESPSTSKAPTSAILAGVPSAALSTTSASTTSAATASSTKRRKGNKRKSQQKYMPCPHAQPPRWETYTYRGKGKHGQGEGAPSVGEMVLEWLQTADDICCLSSPLYGFPHQVRKSKEKLPDSEKSKDEGRPSKDGQETTRISTESVPSNSNRSGTQPGTANRTAGRKTSAVPLTGGSCKLKRSGHEIRFIHAGMRVTVTISEFDASRVRHQSAKSGSTSQLATDPSGRKSVDTTPTLPIVTPVTRAKSDTDVGDPDKGNTKAAAQSTKEEAGEEHVEMWLSCAVCGKDNWDEGRMEMSDGTYLLPFGKFLELLIYSPALCTVEPPLCEHVVSSSAFHPRTTSLPSSTPLSPLNPISPTLSETSSNRFTSRPSATTDYSTSHQVRPSIGNTAVRSFTRGIGWTGTNVVKRASSLRNPADFEPESSADITPTQSRIRSGTHDSGHPTESSESKSAESSQPFPSSEDSGLPESRFNIVRHFSNRTHTVSFSIDKVDDVFELRVPRVQIVRGMSVLGGHSGASHESTINTMGDGSEIEQLEAAEKKKLRREIKAWWEGVADHIDLLEEKLTSESNQKFRKSLPRLPSTDDAYEDEDSRSFVAETPTPKPEGLPASPTTPTGHQGYYFDRAGTHEETESTSSSVTPKGTPKPKRPPLPSIGTNDSVASKDSLSSSEISVLSSSSSEVTEGGSDPAHLLSNLRQTFHRTEQSLYAHLAKTPANSLNDVRRAFLSAAKGVERRLAAWQKKHLGLGLKVVGVRPDGKGVDKESREQAQERERSAKDSSKLSLLVTEPEWWNKTCHVVPGGNIVVREDDWGSIIAFTLSTEAYRHELGAMSGIGSRPLSAMSDYSVPSSPGVMNPSAWLSPNSSSGSGAPSSSSSSSFFASTGYKLFRSSAQSQPDPDQEDVIWHEPEAYSAVISRKEHPRDPTGLLSIRDVLRQKAPGTDVASMGAILSGSRIATLGREGSRLLSSALSGSGASGEGMSRTATPPSAWAKPDVQISRDAAGGEVISGLPTREASADKILQELEAASSMSREGSRPGSAMSGSLSNSLQWSTFEDAHIKRGKASSIISVETNSTIGPEDASVMGTSDAGSISLASAAANKGSYLPPPPTPAKDITVTVAHPMPTNASSQPHRFSTLTSGLTNVMRAMLNSTPETVPRPLSATSSRHHGLLSAEIAPIDERPHIKYDWTIGKRLKFSCTVYYAKQFDILRKRCGVDDVFLQSLSRSQNWSAEGGKSKSNFWKTADDRFIIKTLVNAWNVADLQVLIDLAPSYFRYLDSTACKATVLAKLVGFYTIEIRNLETGNVQSKADLLVMENLFYNQKIDKTFDLKGIQGRKVKTGSNASKTLFDGEWIEGQQQTLTLVQPYSKLVLREAIRNDAEFLARSNIMDYSLLLGVDTKNKQIACGLVDTIGSYTFAKTLEYKAKQGLNAGGGKEVTVIPPAEYQERFVNALERYFMACPDKWSRPLDPNSKVITDLSSLTHIL